MAAATLFRPRWESDYKIRVHGNLTIVVLVSRDCANHRLPGGQLRKRMAIIGATVRLTASQTVNCPIAAMRQPIVHLPT